jgi:hypothetical protein
MPKQLTIDNQDYPGQKQRRPDLNQIKDESELTTNNDENHPTESYGAP